MSNPRPVLWLQEVGSADVGRVGGKNASLGEMISSLRPRGIRVPDGFATTADAYRGFLADNGIEEEIGASIGRYHAGDATLEQTGARIRALFLAGEIPTVTAQAIREAYRELSRRYDVAAADVAVRSSATAEDLPEASFAGQQESFLGVVGEEALLETCRRCYASLFTDRAIAYRDEQGFDHLRAALSVGVQKMVRSDLDCAGVLFTLDPESGFPEVVVVNASWGLGESVVLGTVNPDQYTVFKPFLDRDGVDPILDLRRGSKETAIVYSTEGPEPTATMDTTPDQRAAFALDPADIVQLARWGVEIERHYGRPMDVEWARDGESGQIFIVQARPETVQSRASGATLRSFRLGEHGAPLVSGRGIGQEVAAGEVCLIESAADIGRFRDGAVLVTTRTDPDWMPVMKRAAGIVTDQGGRTSHAAIVSRELGIPAIVGTGDATATLAEGREVTLSCAEGETGHVYPGRVDFEVEELYLDDLPATRTQVMLNIASPEAAMRWWRLPCRGVGLARMEYLINDVIQVHPLALTRFDQLRDEGVRARVEELTRGYPDRTEYFVERLARGIATIAAAQYPAEVIVRTSDFKTNEYAGLIGGAGFEPEEENPMLGWRGASRYYSEGYRDGFALECRALKRVRERMGFDNVIVMIPFCRTPTEADRVLEVMAEHGLRRGEDGLRIYVMAEVPSNVIEAEAFAERFDGFSIGSNDLTQLVLGVSRDSRQLAHLFDESETSVKRMIRTLIETAHAAGRKVGICGERPSSDPAFVAFLVEAGIDSISLTPDGVIPAIERVAEEEAKRGVAATPPALH